MPLRSSAAADDGGAAERYWQWKREHGIREPAMRGRRRRQYWEDNVEWAQKSRDFERGIA